MTETASVVRSEDSSYLQTWAESFAQVLGQISGSSSRSTVLTDSPVGMPPPAPDDLWGMCFCSGGLRGEMSLRLPSTSVLRLAQIFMGEPVASDAEITAERREATLELLRQVAGLVATALKPAFGEVQLRLDAATSAPSWPASSISWLRVGEDPTTSPLVELHVSAALAAALRTEKTEKAEAASPGAASSSANARHGTSAAKGQASLELLLDVELALTLRFGSRRMQLREVLELSPGAVVDLDRQIEDPVDVLLDGRLVARGEVVVVNGNYGLRVTEVGPTGAV
jgi:flagellar motor switch protein FliN